MIPSTTYGIDFGTTTTFLSRQDSTQADVEILALTESPEYQHMDSKVYFDGKHYSVEEPAGQSLRISSPKMMITSGEFFEERDFFGKPVQIVASDAITAILKQVVQVAKEKHGISDFEKMHIRLGCPSSWGSSQRKELMKAVANAGLKRVVLGDVKDEAVACGIAYLAELMDVEDFQAQEKQILVFDMGGGTLDIALLKIFKMASDKGWSVAVLASESNQDAGVALDKRLNELSLKKAQAAGIDTSHYPETELLDAAKFIKERLSSVESVPHPVFPQIEVSRNELEKELVPILVSASNLLGEILLKGALRNPPKSWLVEKLEKDGIPADKIESAIKQHDNQVRERVSVSEARGRISELFASVSSVFLAGGMSRVPAVSDFVRQKLPHADLIQSESADGRKSSRIYSPADELVSRGLVVNTQFEEINAFRPSFNLILNYISESGEPKQHVLFNAYDSIWDSYAQQSDFMVGKEMVFGPNQNLASPRCVLTIARPDGKEIEFNFTDVYTQIEREVLDVPGSESIANSKKGGEIAVTYGSRGIYVKLYASGLLLVRDSAGSESAYDTEWPEMWATSGKQTLSLRYYRPAENASQSMDPWRHK